jgi:hypothetical protein
MYTIEIPTPTTHKPYRRTMEEPNTKVVARVLKRLAQAPPSIRLTARRATAACQRNSLRSQRTGEALRELFLVSDRSFETILIMIGLSLVILAISVSIV